MAEIKIEMTDQDFERLTETSGTWADSWDKGEWAMRVQAEQGRFEATEGPYDAMPQGHWKMAYWLAYDWSHVMLCRAFLAAEGYACEIIYDLGGSYPAELDDQRRVIRPGNPGQYVILTDYESPHHAEKGQ